MAEQELYQLLTLDEIRFRKIRRAATGPITIVLRAITLTVSGLSTSIAANDAGIQIAMLLGLHFLSILRRANSRFTSAPER
jgi:hypothetical protein